MPRDVATALKGQGVELRVPKLTVGDLYIFRGADSLHRVSPVTEGKRVNVIFTYNSEPNRIHPEEVLRGFWELLKDLISLTSRRLQSGWRREFHLVGS